MTKTQSDECIRHHGYFISSLTSQKKMCALHEGKCGTKDPTILIYLTTGGPFVKVLGDNLSSLLKR